jgi:hypothetical protein
MDENLTEREQIKAEIREEIEKDLIVEIKNEIKAEIEDEFYMKFYTDMEIFMNKKYKEIKKLLDEKDSMSIGIEF